MPKEKFSSVMFLSWELQRTKNYSRSRSLQSAWVIYLNEDVVVYRLVKKHSPDRYPNKVQPQTLTLFRNHI